MTPEAATARSFGFERANAFFAGVIDRLSSQGWIASLFLLGLTLATYLPGVVLLPPVDRTEIVYASASRAMLDDGGWHDPRFRGDPLKGKPAGAFWAQAATVAPFGEDAKADISFYRIPSLIGVVIAVLATFHLLAPLLGMRSALVAAALLAVTPLLAVEANLAVADGIVLAPAAVAQLTLLRLYAARDEEPPPWLALSFWTAQGVGVLINALAVPLLSGATVIALLIADRRVDWLTRLRPLIGLPIMLLIGSPWLIARGVADGGVPFQGMAWDELLAALGGSQNDRWKAAPGSFTAAFALGFLPGTAMLVPAAWRLWLDREDRLARFLLAWIVGGLAYLELVSGKPALYSVPPLFPAAAASVALAMTLGQPKTEALAVPPRTLAPWWPIPAIFILAVFGALLWATDTAPSAFMIAGAVLVAASFALSAEAARRKLASAWVALSVLSFAVFLGFTFGVFLPGLNKVWVADRIMEAARPLASCAKGDAGIVGFREPSATFATGLRIAKPDEIAAWHAAGERRVAFVENRWREEFAAAFLKRSAPEPPRLGCVDAYNPMRGCALSFSVHLTGKLPADGAECRLPPAYACATEPPTTPEDRKAEARCR